MIVLCPTRNRPERAQQLLESFAQTARLSTSRLVFAIDQDDPSLSDYIDYVHLDSQRFGWGPDMPYKIVLLPEETGNLVKATNSVASRFWNKDIILGHVGDDHLFRTVGWDIEITKTLESYDVAYGNDLLQEEKLPTAVFMKALIPKTLGWMALPTCQHLYIDNAWKDIGSATRLCYLPNVIIEHMHPGAGKADWDDGYRTVNTLFRVDEYAYREWVNYQYHMDIKKIKEVLGV